VTGAAIALAICVPVAAVTCALAGAPPRPPPPEGRGVVLYGGHFNPPHVAHVAEALAARRAVGARQVLLVPSAPRAAQHEGARVSPAWHHVPAHRRVAMTWLATRGHPDLAVSPLEAGRTDVNYSSSRTVLELAARLEQPVWLLMGTDVLESLPRWERAADVLAAVDLLVTEYPPRPLGRLQDHLPAALASLYREVAPGVYRRPGGREIRLVRFATGGVASGHVRRARETGRPITGLVPRMVERYIEHFGLYVSRNLRGSRP
jgi:nicotinate-nucleotide adenylyltransferase